MKKYILFFLIGVGVIALILYFMLTSSSPSTPTTAPVPQLPAAPAKKDPLAPITSVDTGASSLSHPVGWSADGSTDGEVTQDTSSTYDSHTDIKAGYSVSYPTSWPVLATSDKGFMLVNSKTFSPHSDGTLSSNDSVMSIATIDTKYTVIDDSITDPKNGFSKEKITDRLSHIKQMTIGGKSFRVLVDTSDTNDTYSFIYNKLFFSLSLQSGSKAQHDIDKKAFADFMTSFTLLQ